jgi:hypothetical protein
MSYAQDALDRANRRLGLAADVAFERARRDASEMKRADVLEAEEAREKARRDRSRCREHQSNYEERFAKHGVKAPMAVADDTGPSFRRKLFSVAQTLLPNGHALTRFNPRDLDGSAIVPMEQQLFEALDEQAVRPTGSNLPLSPDDPRARRETTDAMGTKRVEFHAKRSFIADMGRPGRKVLRLFDPRDGKVLLGAPWSRPPG